MLTLGVETSTQRGSLALFNNHDLIAQRHWSRSGSHSEFLSSSLEEILKLNSLKIHNINRLAIGIGPGSFTGIRVGINFVRTLAFALDLPVFNLNSLHLLASQSMPVTSLPIRVVQYAFRNLVYTSAYKLDLGQIVEIEPPTAVTVPQVLSLITEPTFLLGSGSDLLFTEAKSKILSLMIKNPDLSHEPCAKFFINTPALDQGLNHLTRWIHTIPLYVRASEAEEKLKTSIAKS